MCGENACESVSAVVAGGSSPRVRGKRFDSGRLAGPRRLIPACAGKTCTWSLLTKHGQAHPRVCGENQPPAATCTASLGSSPRVRGKPAFATEIPYGLGLIPACAGKTRKGGVCGGRAGAHPRVCGENALFIGGVLSKAGSSPRVRGKLRVTLLASVRPGLIPACAGKTIL